MSQRQAAEVGFTEFTQRQRGWEREQRAKWEVARWIVWQEQMMNPYIKPAHKARRPSDILPLDGDPKPKEVRAEDCHISEGSRVSLEEIFNKLKKRNG